VGHPEAVDPLLGPLEEAQTSYLACLVGLPVQARRSPLWGELGCLVAADVVEDLRKALAAALGVGAVPDERERAARP
jgi:hypothetical protein